MGLKDILMFVLGLLNLNASFNFLSYILIVHLALCAGEILWVSDFTKISDTAFQKCKDLRVICYPESSCRSSLPHESCAFHYHAVCWFKQGAISMSQECSDVYLLFIMNKYLFQGLWEIQSWWKRHCVSLRKLYLVMPRNSLLHS